MIGCPVRNRAWILPAYLQALTELEYPEDKLKFCFIVNDCQDNTRLILEEFTRASRSPVRVRECNHSRPGGYKRGFYKLSRLAELRNILLQEFLESSCEYLFSVDSDILMPPHSLSILLEDSCLMVSALVCNGHEVGDPGLFNVLNRDDDGGYRHLREIPEKTLFRVDCTGAAFLIAREVIEKHGVRYAAGRGAEDIGFCEQASRMGLEIFCDSRVEGLHVMQESMISIPNSYKVVESNHTLYADLIV